VKLNYTQRLIVSVSLYTSLLFCLSLGAAWFTFESIEESEYEASALQVNRLIKSLMSTTPALESSHPQNGIGLYLSDSALPKAYTKFKQPGLYTLANGDELIMDYHPISQQPYYLLLAPPHQDEEGINNEFSDLIVLLMGLIMATFVSGGMAWFLAKRLAQPVIQLKQQINQIETQNLHLTVMERDDEVGELSRSISSLVTRIDQFTQREQEFTRFASHELRTPITILKGNIELLNSTLTPSLATDRVLKRMEKATDRMSALIHAFLWLSREGDDYEQEESLIDLTQFKLLISDCLQHIPTEETERIKVDGDTIAWLSNRFLISILLDNLIHNALKYSSGDIHITAHNDHFTVSNAPIKVTNHSSTGLGLLIVQRICEAKGWQYAIESNDDRFKVVIKCIQEPQELAG
jgi:signal transduction histidine kinase